MELWNFISNENKQKMSYCYCNYIQKMTTGLKIIVEKSYEIFKRYKVVAPLEVCTYCCLTEEQEQELVNLSIRHIPFGLLYDYNTAAKTEKPRIQEFKHFLPRFLEFIADLKFPHHSPELALSRFEYYTKDEWAYEEQELMQEFGQVYFHQYLNVYPFSERIDSILIMLWKAKIDIEPLLNNWLTMINQQSVLHFKDLILWGFKSKKPNELINAFADEELSKLIVQWFEAYKVKEIFVNEIEKIIIESTVGLEDWELEELSQAYELMKVKNTL
jgi:hypothetical protein